MGRPSSYSPDIADAICAELARTGSLRAVCRGEGMPDRATVARWITDDTDGFAARYARAKAIGIDEFVEETLEIADMAVEPVMVPQAKVRIETRRWLAERMLPKSYGPKSGLELSGPDGGPVKFMDSTARAARVMQLMEAARQRMDDGDISDIA